MTDATVLASAIVLSSGMVCTALVRRSNTRGQWAELVADEIRVILDARDQMAKTEKSLDGTRVQMEALYVDNHAVLRELLKREQNCFAREQGLDARIA